MLVQVKVVRILYKSQPSMMLMLRDITDKVNLKNTLATQQLRDRILKSISTNFIRPLHKISEYTNKIKRTTFEKIKDHPLREEMEK
jgi:hypothetical protein